VLLLALAIVDDLGAILVIAFLYSGGLSVPPLLWAGVFLTMTWTLRRVGVRAHGVHAALALLAWMAVLSSGLHATLTGVALAAATPSGHRVRGPRFVESSRAHISELEAARERGDHESAQSALGALEELVIGTEAPLERLERHVHPWSAYLVLPLFALANAGIGLSWASLQSAAGSGVALGIALGLVAGKAIGVAGACWLAVRSGRVTLGSDVRMPHLFGGGFLTGIGFTVALFIAELAFEGSPLLPDAKVGILAGSLAAALIGSAVLALRARADET
jgi:NhaA family Na+:H+ antiporter